LANMRFAVPATWGATSVIIGMVVGLVGVDGFNRWTYRLPRAVDPPILVGFDRDYSGLNIPASSLPGGPRAFHTFYTWVQRLGLVPFSPEGLLEDPEQVRTVFMVYPNRPIPRAKLDELDRWMRRGGTLVVMEGHANPSPAANDWLDRYGVRFDYGAPISGDVGQAKEDRLFPATGMITRGGEPFLFIENRRIVVEFLLGELTRALIGNTWSLVNSNRLHIPEIRSEPVACQVQVGRGRLILVGLADSFQDSLMGTTRATPTPYERKLFDLEFAILRSVTGLPGAPRLTLP
jgi:hypothetical protein